MTEFVDRDDEPVDEFGRPLRPGREESSDSDSDRDYRYRRGRGSSRRDYDRYSPDRSGKKRDGSPKRDRSPSPSSSYRDYRRRRDNDYYSNGSGGRNGMDQDNGNSSNGTHSQRPMSPTKPMTSSSSSSAYNSLPRRIPKRGDIFEGGVFKTFKQFIEYQEDSLSQQELEKKYDEYKVEFSKRQARIFFKDHQTEEWFREKYDPVFLIKKRKEKIDLANAREKEFIEMIKDEGYSFSLTAKDSIVKEFEDAIHHEHDHDHEHVDDHDHHHLNTSDENKMEDDKKPTTDQQQTTPIKPNTTLFIKAISPTCTKEDLLEVFNRVAPKDETENQQPVVTKLTLSEPMKYKNFYRLGWVTFRNNELALKALKELNATKMRDFELHLTLNKQINDTQKRYRIAPKIASTEQRISIDLQQAIDVAKNLDKDRFITNNPFLAEDNNDFNNLPEMERLDRIIHHLRYVHMFCYYCSEEYSDVDELERKCGLIHYRRALGEPSSNETNDQTQKQQDENEKNESDTKTNDTEMNTANEESITTTTNTNNNNNIDSIMDVEKQTTDSDVLWVTNLDNNIKAKINKINNQEQYTCQQAIERSAEEFIQINTFKIDESKFRCSLCAKLFKGTEFVKKHINLKHPEELKKDSNDKGTEEQFFLNYLADPRKMTAVIAQTMYGGYPGGGRMMGGMVPRTRWGTVGPWGEQMMPVPQMMSVPGQAMGMPAMYGTVSPVFSPSTRGRGASLLGPIPMRGGGGRGFVAGGPPMVVGGGVGPMQGGSGGGIRYRPYSARPQPPSDPRGIREYVDLDAPSDSMPDIDYRSALKEYQSKKSTVTNH